VRTGLAIASGFGAWCLVFILLQIVGFHLWDVSPNHIASEALVAFLASLVASLAAETLARRIQPAMAVRRVYLSIGILVAGSWGAMLIFGGRPPVVVLAAYFSALVPFLQGFKDAAKSRARDI